VSSQTLHSYNLDQTDVALQVVNEGVAFASGVHAVGTVFHSRNVTRKSFGNVVQVARTIQRVVVELEDVQFGPGKEFVVDAEEVVFVQVELRKREGVKCFDRLVPNSYLFDRLIGSEGFSVDLLEKHVVRETQFLEFGHRSESVGVDVLELGQVVHRQFDHVGQS
jgi:hypothetical protein